MIIKYPKKLNRGDILGVTATSYGIADLTYSARLDNAYKNLKELGYKCIETANVRTNQKFVSSDGKTRAQEFMQVWQDKKCSCVAQASGGEFLIDMIPYIDKDKIKGNAPKWVFGYSDSSLLNYYLTTNFNIATITCDNIMSFGMDPWYKNIENNLNILESDGEFVQESFEQYEGDKPPREERLFNGGYNLTEKVEYKHLYGKTSDKLSGRLIGGCIDCLVQLLGTPYDNTVKFCKQFDEGILWYLENCELRLPDLYRTLLHMKNGGWFQNANGFLIGRTVAQETVEDLEYLDVLHQIFDDIKVPVVYDIDTGHVAPQWAMMNGSYAEFEYNKGKGRIVQKRI